MSEEFFLENKYTGWYFAIINASKLRGNSGYSENHHIIPKSLGGSNNSQNLVRLTAREHYIVHHLLTKMCVSGTAVNKMWNAFFIMHVHSTENRRFRARTYQLAKSKMAESKRLLMNQNNPFKGKTHSDETRAIMREKRIGRRCRHDPTLYEFTHPNYEPMKITQSDLVDRFDVCRKGINSVVKRKRKSFKGWKIEDQF
jgi:hypothetical protein